MDLYRDYFGLTGKWADILVRESQESYFFSLLSFLDQESRFSIVYPQYQDWYAALRDCPFEKTKVVILGQDPYHEPGQANGKAFSVNKGVPLPPSLLNIYKEIEDEFLIKMSRENGDLTPWAKQGVLLLNSILTVKAGQAASHSKAGWEILTDKLIQELNDDNRPKVFMLWGNFAKSKKHLITNPKHLVLESSHPSPLSANRGGWFDNNHFKIANNFLKENNLSEIDWQITD